MRANSPAERGKCFAHLSVDNRFNATQEKRKISHNLLRPHHEEGPMTIHHCQIGPYDVRHMSYLTDRERLGPVTLQPTTCLCVAIASPRVMRCILGAILSSIAQ